MLLPAGLVACKKYRPLSVSRNRRWMLTTVMLKNLPSLLNEVMSWESLVLLVLLVMSSVVADVLGE